MSRVFEAPGLRDLEFDVGSDSIQVSQEYPEALNQLIYRQSDGVTHFYGSELTLEGDKSVWLSPVEVDDGVNHTYFQILYVNMRPDDIELDARKIPVSLLDIDEAGFKLATAGQHQYDLLLSQIHSLEEHILIRPCHNGMAYYPRAILPNQDPRVIADHTQRLIRATGLRDPELSVRITKKPDLSLDMPTIDNAEIIHARRYPFYSGELFSYGVVRPDDPWGYYEVFTPAPIDQLPKEDVLIRIDSGCDIGQIYDDRGCDCREQLHGALLEMQRTGNGAVIHVPAQDGRGYGAATKMETEGMKMGIPVCTNRENPKPINTVQAAKELLGEPYDIRTYSGTGKILGQLGMHSVRLATDNKLKVRSLANGGIDVNRVPTNTRGGSTSVEHIAAKHATDMYYGPEEE